MFFRKKKRVFSYKCSDCGDIHKGSPSVYQKRPIHYLNVPKSERDDLTVTSDDLCIIYKTSDKNKEDASYFIRTILEIPITNVEEPMLLGVWVSQSHDSFQKYFETFDDDQSDFSSFGWLHVNQPHYQSFDADGFMTRLGCDVVGQSGGHRPRLYLHDSDHELVFDQRNGISWEKAEKIHKLWIHP